jgi:hypothetical protein
MRDGEGNTITTGSTTTATLTLVAGSVPAGAVLTGASSPVVAASGIFTWTGLVLNRHGSYKLEVAAGGKTVQTAAFDIAGMLSFTEFVELHAYSLHLYL